MTDRPILFFVRWAYSKLHWTRHTEMHDALMLDRMRMKLEFDL